MTPHLCPRCGGERVVLAIVEGVLTTVAATRSCPTCFGQGVLWEEDTDALDVDGLLAVGAAEAAAAQEAFDDGTGEGTGEGSE